MPTRSTSLVSMPVSSRMSRMTAWIGLSASRTLPPGRPQRRCPWLCWQSSTRPAASKMTAPTAEVSEFMERKPRTGRVPWPGGPANSHGLVAGGLPTGAPTAVACAPVNAPTVLAAIPSPSQGVWHLGPIPVRAYALCIVLGIIAACVITEIRMRRRGAPPYAVLDIAVWAVPAGIIGARIYHVITSPDDYFGAHGNWVNALRIWHGGLGIWGAVAGGAVGAWIAARRLGIPLSFVADALAPGLPVAQAIGRLGNWFNNELYGRATTLPWGLRIYNWDPAKGQAVLDEANKPDPKPGLYHPTFLCELIWDLGVAV